MNNLLESCACLLQYYISETLQIHSKLVLSYILFYLLCQDALAKLASIFVIAFQFKLAYSIAYGLHYTILQLNLKHVD